MSMSEKRVFDGRNASRMGWGLGPCGAGAARGRRHGVRPWMGRGAGAGMGRGAFCLRMNLDGADNAEARRGFLTERKAWLEERIGAIDKELEAL